LWDRLDEFSTRTNSYAYKQVEEMMAPPFSHGHRQWRCEAEQAVWWSELSVVNPAA
jgi:hypothetical protein